MYPRGLIIKLHSACSLNISQSEDFCCASIIEFKKHTKKKLQDFQKNVNSWETLRNTWVQNNNNSRTIPFFQTKGVNGFIQSDNSTLLFQPSIWHEKLIYHKYHQAIKTQRCRNVFGSVSPRMQLLIYFIRIILYLLSALIYQLKLIYLPIKDNIWWWVEGNPILLKQTATSLGYLLSQDP